MTDSLKLGASAALYVVSVENKDLSTISNSCNPFANVLDKADEELKNEPLRLVNETYTLLGVSIVKLGPAQTGLSSIFSASVRPAFASVKR